jgi:hypothetical protein
MKYTKMIEEMEDIDICYKRNIKKPRLLCTRAIIANRFDIHLYISKEADKKVVVVLVSNPSLDIFAVSLGLVVVLLLLLVVVLLLLLVVVLLLLLVVVLLLLLASVVVLVYNSPSDVLAVALRTIVILLLTSVLVVVIVLVLVLAMDVSL